MAVLVSLHVKACTAHPSNDGIGSWCLNSSKSTGIIFLPGDPGNIFTKSPGNLLS